MEAPGGLLQAATYARTRPLTGDGPRSFAPARALRAEAALKLPKGSPDTLRDIGRRRTGAHRCGRRAARRPASHAWRASQPSGFAAIDDVDSVPVRAEGKDRYRHYLTLPSPKAFVVYARGGWRFYFGTPEAMGMALDRCERDNTPCWLYAVDDQVVWQSDAAHRVGSKARVAAPTLRPGPSPVGCRGSGTLGLLVSS